MLQYVPEDDEDARFPGGGWRRMNHVITHTHALFLLGDMPSCEVERRRSRHRRRAQLVGGSIIERKDREEDAGELIML